MTFLLWKICCYITHYLTNTYVQSINNKWLCTIWLHQMTRVLCCHAHSHRWWSSRVGLRKKVLRSWMLTGCWFHRADTKVNMNVFMSFSNWFWSVPHILKENMECGFLGFWSFTNLQTIIYWIAATFTPSGMIMDLSLKTAVGKKLSSEHLKRGHFDLCCESCKIKCTL